MRSLEDIKAKRESYLEKNGGIYQTVRSEQKTDQSYYDDTFPVPEVHSPHVIYRSGMGVRIIDAPAEQIVTSNPQVFIERIKGTEESAIRIARMFNEKWIDTLKRQNPNPFKESVKNPLLRGETFVRTIASPSWTMDKLGKIGLPVVFTCPDPMVIYASPEEDDDGRPEIVMIFYSRQPRETLSAYPNWKNPKNRKDDGKEKVEWFEFWDKDTRYCEADGEAVLGGIKPNPYGFVPFVRKYSGFGRRSPDGELSNLIVSDIKRSRDLLKEECAMRSNIASVQYLFAHKDLLITSEGELNDDALKEMQLGAYTVNAISNLPPNTKIGLGLSERLEQISASSLQHHRDIIGELNQRHPFIMAGFPLGSSGRQDDIAQMLALRRYDSIIDGTESMWATAFEMAWKICKKLNIVPDGLTEKDMETEFRCIVKLRAKDPIEEDRKVTMGSRLLSAKEIDPITNLTEFKGYTEERANQIMVDMLKWEVLLNSPEIRQLIGMKAVEKAGMTDYLNILKAQNQVMSNQQGMMETNMPATTQQRIQGEVKTPTGNEQSAPRGMRQPPMAYTRGGM